VRFWDASAVLPLLVDEARTEELRALAGADGAIVVWWLTRTECVSALARRTRDGELSLADERSVRTVLHALERSWSEVQPSERLRGAAERLLAVHDLRAADALQLAAAVEWCGGDAQGAALVCLDRRLRVAAHREGFRVLPERE
jgi:predicted nucleic acid-binding protein